MAFICSLPVVLSAALLAAHFYRAGLVPAALLCLLCPSLLLWRRRWVPPLISLFLLAASLEWLRTLFILVASYRAMGLPYGRLTLILTVVATLTLLSATVFRSGTMRRRYGNS